MSKQFAECAICKKPVEGEVIEHDGWSYLWFHCKVCGLKWTRLFDRPKDAETCP